MIGSASATMRIDDMGGSQSSLVVLRWSGGVSSLYPTQDLEPLDLASFKTDDGFTLADFEEVFKEEVRWRVETILNDSPLLDVNVIIDEKGSPAAETIVHLAQEVSPVGDKEIGRGDFDPCNLRRGDEAVIFGEQILALGGEYSFDEWVNVFANVSAHETAHTLGFGHTPRPEHPVAERPLFIELMFGGHTMAEMRLEQRIMAEPSACTQ